ncbi:MAG: hypothetical protein ACK55I_50405, partial [bacterium]
PTVSVDFAATISALRKAMQEVVARFPEGRAIPAISGASRQLWQRHDQSGPPRKTRRFAPLRTARQPASVA